MDADEGFVTDYLVRDEFVAVGTFDDRVRSVDALTGEGNWVRRFGTSVWSVDRRGDGSLVVVAAPGTDPTATGREAVQVIYAVDERTGAVRDWLDLAPGEQVAVDERTVYVWDAATGAVAAVGPGSEVRWSVDLGVGIRTLVATEDGAYVSTADDALVALGR